MSWLLNTLVGKPEEEEESEEEKPPQEGGVRNDLSQLQQSFSRQLKGFSSFLTGEEEEDVDGDDAEEDPDYGLGDESGEGGTGGGLEDEGNVTTPVCTDASPEGKRHPVEVADAEGNVVVPLTPKLTAETAGNEVAKKDSLEGEGSKSQLRGMRDDLAALSGTMRNQLSRFSSVMRVVTGEDIAKPAGPKGETEELLSPGTEAGTAKDRRPLLPFLGLGYPPVAGGSWGGLDGIPAPDSKEEDHGEGEEEEHDSILRAAQEDIHALREGFASGISGISKFASDLLPFKYDPNAGSDGDEEGWEEAEAVGVNDDVIALATNLSAHPETWIDFPLPLADSLEDSFRLSASQEEHLEAVEDAVPRLAALRAELCPQQMSEDRFLLIYFVLLHTKLQPLEAEALSTPQVVEARRKVLQVLQERADQSKETEGEEDETEEKEEAGEGKEDVEEVDRGGKEEEKEVEEGEEVEEEGAKEEVKEEGKEEVGAEEEEDVDTEKEEKDVEEGKEKKGGEKEEGEEGEEETEADDWLEEEGGGDGEEVTFSDLEEEGAGAGKAGAPLAAAQPATQNEMKVRGWVQLSADADGKEDTCGSDSSSGARGSGSEKADDWLKVEGEDVPRVQG